MKSKIKRIVAQEGLIVISIAFIASMCMLLDNLQSKKFNNAGHRFLNTKKIEQYNLFILDGKQKPEGFDLSTAIPVNTCLTRKDFQVLAKKELLNRNGFNNFEWSIVYFDDLEARFGQSTGEKVDRYFEERNKLKQELKNWSNKRLAEMSGISLEHFNNSIKQISHLKKKINFSSTAIFLFIFAYPIYLLIRFIIWAIKTLKIKGK